MTLYILNAAAIWLISLVIFDLFFRRENYHGYNRFYLLCTFLAGLLLPLWHWDSSHHIVYTALKVPAQQVMLIKQSAASPDIPGKGFEWTTIIYCAGALTMLALLIVDIVKLYSLYHGGKRSRQGSWTVVETHREHAPFSFLNLLFVSSKMLYNPEEWNMLLLHEHEHSRLFHFADMLLMQLARVFFWFNPLVYIYNRRLTLVHEYQADAAAIQEPKVYGRFLVEQMMLRSAPSISHALSNEHVKKRILMLSHTSPDYRQLAKLLVFPLIALFLLCFTRYDIEYQDRYNEAACNQNVYQPPVTGLNGVMGIPVTAGDNVAVMQGNENKTSCVTSPRLSIYNPAYQCSRQGSYSKSRGDEISLAGMENNNNAKCCSSDLLWGNNYGNITVTTAFPEYEPVYLSVNVNSCSPDIYRNDAYDRVAAMYRHTQESWTMPADNSMAALGAPTGMSNRIIVADDPWNDRPYKSPGVVPPLSMDRSVFGGNEKTIFDNAVAMAIPYRETTGIAASHDWLMINGAYTELKTVYKVNKTAATH